MEGKFKTWYYNHNYIWEMKDKNQKSPIMKFDVMRKTRIFGIGNKIRKLCQKEKVDYNGVS